MTRHRSTVMAMSAALLLVAVSYSTTTTGETLGQHAQRLGVPVMPPAGVDWDWSNNDISGKVGYPLTVPMPRANCPSGPWGFHLDIASGQLPPGLAIGDHGRISGVPTARGHWIVVFRLNNVTCGGHHYTTEGIPDVVAQTQAQPAGETCAEGYHFGYCSLRTVRFHITGTGEVVQ
jgi:hypothetical protein